MKKLLSLAALVGVSGIGAANADPATLYRAETYSKGNPAAMSVKVAVGNTSTWDLDTATGVATQTGGTFAVKLGTMFTHTMTGGVLGNAPAAATDWNCIEGTFGAPAPVFGYLCGNVHFGANTVLDSTIGDSGTAVTVVLLGDDFFLGPPQTLANSYSDMTLVSLGANAGVTAPDGSTITGGTNWRLSNRNAGSTAGYTFDFNVQPVGTAVDDGPVDVAGSVAIHVGANDTNFSNPVTITRTLPDPTKGTATVTTASGNAADVIITYTANDGATGTDSFGYQITDGTFAKTAIVTVNILEFGANDDSYTTTRGVALTGLTPAVNDTGYVPDTVTVTPGACSSGDGTIVVTAGNGGPQAGVLVTYTPPANNPAAGSITTLNDSCAYTIGNGGAQPDTPANILVGVSNSLPVANDGNASAISTAGVAPAGRTATFTSPGAGGSLGNAGVTSTANGTHGNATVAAGGHIITYTVTDAAFFTGSDSFTYTVTDTDGAASPKETDTGTVSVTIADVLPTIADGNLSTTTGTASAAFSPVITWGNGAASQHPLAISTNGANGSCTLSATNGTGTLSYTSAAGYTGPDSCVLTLTDGDGDTDTATINITVNADDSIKLPGGSSSMDLWSLSLLGSLPLLLRRRRRRS